MLVLITGKAGSGKDTIGGYLKNEYGFETDSLAAPIKRLVKDVFVLPEEVVYDRELREKELGDPWIGMTVRSLLQKIGTELFRDKIHKDVWVLSLLRRISSAPQFNWVVTDLRFPNEKDVLEKRYEGKIVTIKVSRPGKTGKTDGGIKGHESESYDIHADFSVENKGSFEDLYRQIDEIMEQNGLISFSKKRDLNAIKIAGEILEQNGI